MGGRLRRKSSRDVGTISVAYDVGFLVLAAARFFLGIDEGITVAGVIPGAAHGDVYREITGGALDWLLRRPVAEE